MNFRPVDNKPPQTDRADDCPETLTDQLRNFWRRNVIWFLLAALGLLILQDVFGTHGVLAMRRAQNEAVREQVELDRINQQNVELQSHVNSLKSDPEAIERIAREQMGLARPGEYIFKISPKPQGNKAPKPSSPSNRSAKTP
jgi:cell division protein FtsB